jgi:hypothetical protein
MSVAAEKCKWGFRNNNELCNEFNYFSVCSRGESQDFCVLKNGRFLKHQCCFVLNHDEHDNPVFCLAYHKNSTHFSAPQYEK